MYENRHMKENGENSESKYNTEMLNKYETSFDSDEKFTDIISNIKI